MSDTVHKLNIGLLPNSDIEEWLRFNPHIRRNYRHKQTGEIFGISVKQLGEQDFIIDPRVSQLFQATLFPAALWWYEGPEKYKGNIFLPMTKQELYQSGQPQIQYDGIEPYHIISTGLTKLRHEPQALSENEQEIAQLVNRGLLALIQDKFTYGYRPNFYTDEYEAGPQLELVHMILTRVER